MPIDERGDFRLTGNIDTITGGDEHTAQFNVRINYTGARSSLNPIDMVFGQVPPEDLVRRVEITPQNIADVTGRANDLAERARDRIEQMGGNAASSLPGSAGGLAGIGFGLAGLPSPFGGGGGGVGLPRQLSNIASMNVDSMPYENIRDITFTPITIPELPGERIDINDIPPLQFQFQVILDQVSRNDYPTVIVELEPDVLFQTREIDQVIECGETFSNLFNDIESVRDRIEQTPVTRRDVLQQQSIRLSSIGEQIPLGQARDRLESQVDNIEISRCQSQLRSELSGIEIEGCAETTDFYTTINNRIDRLESRVQDITGEASDLRERAQQTEVGQRAQEFADRTTQQQEQTQTTSDDEDGGGDLPPGIETSPTGARPSITGQDMRLTLGDFTPGPSAERQRDEDLDPLSEETREEVQGPLGMTESDFQRIEEGTFEQDEEEDDDSGSVGPGGRVSGGLSGLSFGPGGQVL